MGWALEQVDATISARLAGQDLIVFDGECVLCSRFYRFVQRFDHNERFAFATAQSPLGQQFFDSMGLPTDDFETNLVVVNGQVFTHLDSFAAVMGALGWPWRILHSARFLPVAVKRPVYGFIARNRYRIFGRSDVCLMPDAKAQLRFVKGGW